MTSWCFKNSFKAPPANFTAPNPLTNCTQPMNEWCSSTEIAKNCDVSILQYFSDLTLLKSHYNFRSPFAFRLLNGVKLQDGYHHLGNWFGDGQDVNGIQHSGVRLWT